ncbi:ubiquinone/menaquinone biosynthesis C-methyltransferase UbiE [archaeon MnTg01]|nr:ubiquinone/menaquinone biosynthesis C-methyltransferase UbiE [archaeon MnTg01]
MDKVRTTFDEWAKIGRSELMEKEHSKTVLKFLNSIRFEKPFSFLDVGCGNGWVVRKISQIQNCKKAVGIDKSQNMITKAKSKKKSSKENYLRTDILSWKFSGKFDYIFSMESLYYSTPMESALKKIYRLLKPGGEFFCGTDFYSDNKATIQWSKMLDISLDLRSKKQWKKMFEEIGFKTKTKQVRDSNNRKKWKREFGTLFIIGKK